MKSLYFAAVAALILALASCKEKSLEEAALPELLQADAIMETDPAGAYKKLCEIDPAKVKKGVNRALYSLLITQAEDKNFIDSTSDNVIAIASDFFDSNPGLSPEHRMRAHFYHARILYNARHYASASEHLMVALDIAGQLKSHYWLGRINALFADLYSSTYNYPEAIPCIKRAIDEYRDAFQQEFMTDAIYDLAIAYVNAGLFNDAIEYISEIRQSLHNDSINMKLTGVEAVANFYSGNLLKAKSLYITVDASNSQLLGTTDYSDIAYIYGTECKTDSMLIFLEKASKVAKCPEDSAHVMHAYINYYSQKDDLEHAKQAMDSFMLYLNRFWKNAVREHPNIGKTQHFIRKADEEKKRKEFYKSTAIIISCCATAIFIIGILYMRERNRRKRTELTALLSRYDNLIMHLKQQVAQADDNDAHNNHMEQTGFDILTKFLVESRFNDINALSRIIFKHSGKEADEQKNSNDQSNEEGKNKATNGNQNPAQKESALIAEFKNMLVRLNTHEALNEMETILNLCHGNVISRLRQDFPNMKKPDIALLIMMFSGMSSHTICIAMNLGNLTTFRTRKKRIRQTIMKSSSEWKDLFLSHF